MKHTSSHSSPARMYLALVLALLVTMLLAEFNRLQGSPLSRPPAVSAAGLVEPLLEALSERKTDVLHLLAQGRSNQDIADELCLSLVPSRTMSAPSFASSRPTTASRPPSMPSSVAS